MIVVADTSPLNYLILIEEIDVLKHLYGRIAMPSAVQAEMLSPKAPATVQFWAMNLPTWAEVRTSSERLELMAKKRLDAGEREAISLALDLKSPILIMDDSAGRAEAQTCGLHVIGTIGILREAHAAGLLDLQETVERLTATSCRIPPAFLAGLFLRG